METKDQQELTQKMEKFDQGDFSVASLIEYESEDDQIEEIKCWNR